VKVRGTSPGLNVHHGPELFNLFIVSSTAIRADVR
jgi:hypothetical protein